MAEKIVSPGVFTRENDLSFIAQGVGAIGGVFIGPLKQGPAFKPTIVNTQSEFEDIFGVVDSTYYTENAVQNYLRETGVATIVRVAGLGGYEELGPIGLIASGSGFQKLVYTLNNTENSNTSASFTGSAFTTLTPNDAIEISGSHIGGDYSVSLSPSDTLAVTKVFGTSALGSKNAYAYTAYENILGTAHYTASAVILPLQDFTENAVGASTPYIQSQLIGGSRYNLFKVNTIADGNVENTRFKIVISDVKAAGSVAGSDYATFTLQVRKYNDTDKRKYVLETFSNLNLDPTSPNYIARAIGDRYVTSDATGKITEYGDYSNKSRYIYIAPVNPDTIPVTAAPYANAGYSHPIWAGLYTGSLVDVSYQTKSATTASYVSGFDYEGTLSTDNTQFLKPIPANATTTTGFALDAGGTGYASASLDLTGSAAVDVAKRTFAIALQGGFDGMTPAKSISKGASITATNSQGFDLSTSAKSGSVAYQRALDAISNQDEYDINLVVLPGVIQTLHPSVAQAGIDLCEARTDCFYIMDSVAQDGTIAGAVEVAETLDTNYAATYYPWIKTIDLNTNKLVAVPPSVLMPAVFAANDNSAAEWFAPAGLNRGGITGAIGVVNRLTHADRDTLYEGKVNPIAQFPGQGIVAFGQKTLQSKPSALDRINVRRLLITVKKYIASTSRYLVFEQNTTETRNRFLNTVNPYLEGIQQRQGLYAFRVVMDDSNNTPDVIDRNILQGAIFLQPTKTAEFIQIDFNILPTGATFGA